VTSRLEQLVAARQLQHEPFDRDQLLDAVRAEVMTWSLGPKSRAGVWSALAPFLASAAAAPGHTVQQWWEDLETRRWAVTAAQPGRGVTWSAAAVRALVVGRFVTPSWALISTVQVQPWLRPLPGTDPLAAAHDRLRAALGAVGWATPKGRRRGICTGMRLMLAHGYDNLAELRDQDMAALPPGANGTDMLDIALCQLGVFARSPRRGTVRRKTEPAKTIEVLVAAKVPEVFREVTVLYMTAYAQRVSANYATTRTKIRSLAYFWVYLTEVHPQVTRCRDVLPHHARGFVGWALVKARTLQRDAARKGKEDRTTTYDWMVDVRAFFTDLCTWGTEPGSPLADHAPSTVPLTSHDLNSRGFAAARARTTARMTASVMDLAREVPNIRAFALRRWHEAAEQLLDNPDDHVGVRGERDAFWDWALLELLLTSGLRVEEASELTTLDVLKRQLPDGQIYYLLHIKPSKYDRARVIPVGDGLNKPVTTRHRPAGGFDYEQHGRGYAGLRQPDPRITARVHAALGASRTVLNVGAGAGSYEPADRYVLAVELSAATRAQRPVAAATAVDATEERLP